jgi:predicted nucleic acid-binding protein
MPASARPRIDVFFDSNVVLYLADRDGAKAARTMALLAAGGVVSTHVLGEVTNVMRGRRWKRPWVEVRDLLDAISANTVVVPVTAETQSRAVKYAERYMLQYFDALHVAAAVLAGCKTLYSEDMHDGLVIDGLTVRNPFA